MDPKAIAAELERTPFVPLRLHLSDGRTFDVTDLDIAVVSGLSLYLFKVRGEHPALADDTHLIALRHVVSIE